MIPERDREPAGAEHQEKERALEPIEAEIPDVERHRGEREEKRADEERAGDPVDTVKGDVFEQGLGVRGRSKARSVRSKAVRVQPEKPGLSERRTGRPLAGHAFRLAATHHDRPPVLCRPL